MPIGCWIGVSVTLAASIAVGCAGRGQSLSPVQNLPPEAISNEAASGERFYILVFGSERCVRLPRYTHTWAAVVKTCEAPGQPPQVAEVQTISWMPASLEVRPWRFAVEPGRNLELHETIRMALACREQIAMWGPCEIRPRLYRRFLLQKSYLESGCVGYQCIDTVGEAARGAGSDCIHAITDMDPVFERDYYPLTRYGMAGSENIAEQLLGRGLLVDGTTHSWLEAPLGLCRHPIIRRQPCMRSRVYQ
jgi:hypothetical protein